MGQQTLGRDPQCAQDASRFGVFCRRQRTLLNNRDQPILQFVQRFLITWACGALGQVDVCRGLGGKRGASCVRNLNLLLRVALVIA